MSKNHSVKDIILGGYCKDCPYAELSIEKKAEVSRLNGEMAEFNVYCEHEKACERMTFRDKKEWIHVSEKMPKDNQDVLITIKKGTATPDSFFARDSVDLAIFCDVNSMVDGLPYQHFYVPDAKAYKLPIDNVSAWMPLPDPYKE